MKKGIQLANHCPKCKSRKKLHIYKGVVVEYDIYNGHHHIACLCGQEGPTAKTEKIAIQRWNNLPREDWKALAV